MDGEKEIPRAAHSGEINIGGAIISCAVLEDGTRVLSERAVSSALGSKRGGSHWRRLKDEEEPTGYLPVYISAKNLRPFISDELADILNNKILYRTNKSGANGYGIEASALPKICDVLLKARDEGALLPSQVHIAHQADILMRGLAHIGIISLIDEATGYQDVRDRQALEQILDKFIAKEYIPWTRQFPNEFYKEIYRLKGWRQPLTGSRPGVIGRYTNDLVYERMAPGILEELKKKTPVSQKGNKSRRLHQALSKDVGHPKLGEHLSSLIVLMRAAENWDQFYRMVDRAFPRFGDSIPLDFCVE